MLVQGYNREEGIDYDKTVTSVVTLEAIKLLIAFTAHMKIILYQMDVKSVFLNGLLKEAVYVKQSLGFEKIDYPNHDYKLEKKPFKG